jgi:hypothetical protein
MRCPFCGAPITVPIQRVIDANDQPELKAQLLNGRLNAFTCPTCHNSGAVAAPFIYHDANKELALIFLPLESGLNLPDQQKVIGQLTQAVMNATPPEKRKAYLLQPQQFFVLQTLIEEVLRADGITPEVLKAQQAKIELLQRLIDTKDDQAFAALAKENDAQIDTAFFQLLSMVLGGAEADNRPDEFDRLMAVRDRLLDLTTAGQKVKAQTQLVEDLIANPTRESLIDHILAAPDSSTREALLTVGRPLLDYPFFQQFTAKIDAAKASGDTAEADRLGELRKEILSLRDKIDAQTQMLYEQRATVLRELMVSENLDAAVQARINSFDEVFFNVLTSQMQAAQQAGDTASAERLRVVGNAAMRAIQSLQPPEVQFVNALLSVEYPDQTRQLLERNKQALAPEFITWLSTVAEGLREDGRGDQAGRLELVIGQAREMAGAATG